MELIALVNSVLIFVSQMTLLRLLTFRLEALTVTLTVLLFWIYFYLLTLVFVLQWLSLHGKFWPCCCLSFHWLSLKLKTGCPISSNCSPQCWSFTQCCPGNFLMHSWHKLCNVDAVINVDVVKLNRFWEN